MGTAADAPTVPISSTGPGRQLSQARPIMSALSQVPKILRPRQDSNLRSRLRRPMLYPLSYEGIWPVGPEEPVDRSRRDVSPYCPLA
jgi:hypothetical protein